MKDNLGSDYFLLAHIDTEKARFKKSHDLGIEFTNSIDAWNRMAFKFRNAPFSKVRYAKTDLKPLVYSFRSKLD